MEKTAVLPVPLCDCAMRSRPFVIGTMARCWIAEGFSKPAHATRAQQKWSQQERSRPRHRPP
jgi:hypothetical protein